MKEINSEKTLQWNGRQVVTTLQGNKSQTSGTVKLKDLTSKQPQDLEQVTQNIYKFKPYVNFILKNWTFQ